MPLTQEEQKDYGSNYKYSQQDDDGNDSAVHRRCHTDTVFRHIGVAVCLYGISRRVLLDKLRNYKIAFLFFGFYLWIVGSDARQNGLAARKLALRVWGSRRSSSILAIIIARIIKAKNDAVSLEINTLQNAIEQDFCLQTRLQSKVRCVLLRIGDGVFLYAASTKNLNGTD